VLKTGRALIATGATRIGTSSHHGKAAGRATPRE
jgi:hypothetical protein